MAASLLFATAPVIARTLLILPDKKILSDGTIRLFYIPVFSIGFFYVVAGRAGNKQHTLASGINRIQWVALPACILAWQGVVDWGQALLMLLYDGLFGLITLLLVARYGLDEGFEPKDP